MSGWFLCVLLNFGLSLKQLPIPTWLAAMGDKKNKEDSVKKDKKEKRKKEKKDKKDRKRKDEGKDDEGWDSHVAGLGLDIPEETPDSGGAESSVPLQLLLRHVFLLSVSVTYDASPLHHWQLRAAQPR